MITTLSSECPSGLFRLNAEVNWFFINLGNHESSSECRRLKKNSSVSFHYKNNEEPQTIGMLDKMGARC